MTKNDVVVLAVGFAGQSLFFLRFFVQWLHSEKHKRSLIPTAFWYFSLGGSALLLVYAVMRKDLVFTIGQVTGFLIYSRNLTLIARSRRQEAVVNDEAVKSSTTASAGDVRGSAAVALRTDAAGRNH